MGDERDGGKGDRWKKEDEQQEPGSTYMSSGCSSLESMETTMDT